MLNPKLSFTYESSSHMGWAPVTELSVVNAYVARNQCSLHLLRQRTYRIKQNYYRSHRIQTIHTNNAILYILTQSKYKLFLFQ